MGVDFYGCASCGESLYSEYVGNCTSCGVSLCTYCLNKNDIDSRYASDYGLKFEVDNPELMDTYIAAGYNLYNESGVCWYEDGDIIDDSGIQETYCPYCKGEEIDDKTLLKFMLEKYKVDKETLWKEYKKTIK